VYPLLSLALFLVNFFSFEPFLKERKKEEEVVFSWQKKAG